MMTEMTKFQDKLMQLAQLDNVDPDKLEKLLDLQLRFQASQSQTLFNEAMSNFQKDCPIITKKKKVEFGTTKYDYAPFDEMVYTIKPIMSKFGLSFSFDVKELDDGYSNLIITIAHSGGHSKDFTWAFKSFHDDKRMNESQRRKSALSYAKRAGLENALGLAVQGEDDDAQRCEEYATKEQVKEIKELIKESGTDEATFCKHFKIASLKGLTALSEKDASKAITQLKTKIKGLK